MDRPQISVTQPMSTDWGHHLQEKIGNPAYAKDLVQTAITHDDVTLLRGAVAFGWKEDAHGMNQHYRHAIVNGSSACVDYLIRNGQSPHYIPAVDSEVIRSASGANTSRYQREVTSPIRLAAHGGHLKVIDVLVHAGVRPKVDNAAAVIDAVVDSNFFVSKNATHTLSLLMDNGWNVWSKFPNDPRVNQYKFSGFDPYLHGASDPLYVALKQDKLDVARMICERSPDQVARLDGDAIVCLVPVLDSGSGVLEKIRLLLEFMPKGPLARGLNDEGKTVVERFPWEDTRPDVQNLLLGYTLTGDRTGKQNDTAMSKLTKSAREDVRLRGLSGLSWSPTSSAIAMIAALTPSDRHESLAVLSHRFMDGATRGDPRSACALGQLSAASVKRGWDMESPSGLSQG